MYQTMEYLERFAKICSVAELSESQIILLRDITDPLYEKDCICNIKELRSIISLLVKHELCEELAEIIQNKWTHIEFEPNAYDDLADDVSCG